MKLLVISHSAVITGYQNRFSEISRKSGMAITVLVPRHWRQFNTEVELRVPINRDFRVIPRQPFCWGLRHHGLRNAAHIYPGLNRLIRNLRPDIVEIWAEPFAAVTAQAVRGVLRTQPRSKTIFFSAQNVRRFYPPPFSFFERFVFRHADFAFPINLETRQILREKGWRKGATILPMGIDPDHFRQLDSSNLRNQLKLRYFTIGFLGKFDQQKGILDLVRTISQLCGNVNLLLIGQGPLRSQVLRMTRELHLEDTVRIIDPISHDKLPDYLNCMDVLVLPSITMPGLKEQFGRVLIEAMSCSVPVIGSDSGEIPNVIGDAGLIFPEGDGVALRARITSLLNDPGYAQELGRKGRRRVEEEYSWSAIAERQIEVYRRLLGEKS